MSILEALAQCGDLTIYGKRDNVLLIRQEWNALKLLNEKGEFLTAANRHLVFECSATVVTPWSWRSF